MKHLNLSGPRALVLGAGLAGLRGVQVLLEKGFDVEFFERLEEFGVDRDMVVHALRAENSGAGIHYLMLCEHPYYAQALPYRVGDFSVAESMSKRALTLLLSPSMSEEDVWDVIEVVRLILSRYRKRDRTGRKKSGVVSVR